MLALLRDRHASREFLRYLRGVAGRGEILGLAAIEGRGTVPYWQLDGCWFAVGDAGGEGLCGIAVRFGECGIQALAKGR